MRDHDKPTLLDRPLLLLGLIIIGNIIIWGGSVALAIFIVVKMLRWLDVIC